MASSRLTATPPAHVQWAATRPHDPLSAEDAHAAALALQATVGNRAAGRLLAEGAGQPIDPAIRREVEPVLGTDLSSVRVHVGHDATEAAQALHARAFTIGDHIGFAPGAFAPALAGGAAFSPTSLLMCSSNAMHRRATPR